jgi:hypothetical protein
MNVFLSATPYILLILAAIGFILNLMADHFHVQHRMKIGFVLVFLACVAVLAMR